MNHKSDHDVPFLDVVGSAVFFAAVVILALHYGRAFSEEVESCSTDKPVSEVMCIELAIGRQPNPPDGVRTGLPPAP